MPCTSIAMYLLCTTIASREGRGEVRISWCLCKLICQQVEIATKCLIILEEEIYL